MGIKDLKAKTASVAARAVERKQDDEIRTAPVRMYDVTQRMHDAERRVGELEAALATAKTDGTVGRLRKLPVKDLHEVTGRRRRLSAAEYQEMKENIRVTGKILDPIRVAPRLDGGWEIISGNNKTAIIRELGWEEVECLIDEVDKAQADLDGFFANLFQNKLPDYEQYLGFRMIRERRPHLTHEEIADMAGVSRSHVTRLMAFESLPEAAIAALEQNVRALGASAAVELATLAKNGKGEAVTKAIQRLVAGEIDQTRAVQEAIKASAPLPTNAEKKATTHTVKQGKATYCSLRHADRTIRLDFKTIEEAAAIKQAILDLLESRAKG